MSIWPGENLLIKLVDTLQNGIGATFRPWSIKRDEAARVEGRKRELLTLAQVEKDVDEIRAGTKFLDSKGNLLSSPETQKLSSTDTQSKQENIPATTELIKIHQRETGLREFQRSINLRKIAVYAEEEVEHFENNDDVSEEPVDPDWFARWRSFAEDASREEMQRLWGRILAGEVKSPGSYTIHAMDFLARMSFNDAVLLAKLAQLRIEDAVFKGDDAGNGLQQEGISFNDILYLNDINILNGVTGIGGLHLKREVQSTINGRYAIVQYNKIALVFFTEKDNITHLELPVYSVSAVGREIMSLAHLKPNFDYLKRLAEFGGKKGFNKVRIGYFQNNNIVNLKDFYITPSR